MAIVVEKGFIPPSSKLSFITNNDLNPRYQMNRDSESSRYFQEDEDVPLTFVRVRVRLLLTPPFPTPSAAALQKAVSRT